MYVIAGRIKLFQMVVHKGVYHIVFLIFMVLLDSLTYGTVDTNKTTVCTGIRYVQMYDTYRSTMCTDVMYVKMYDMYRCTL